jgi:hypothetical protein
MFDTSLNELERDATGRCKGECRDRAREGELDRQAAINREHLHSPDDYPSAKWAESRDMQPGVFGGHV